MLPATFPTFISQLCPGHTGVYKVNWCVLFLQLHRETDRFFAASGVQLAQSDRDQFHYKRAAFSSQLKSKVGSILDKVSAVRITLNVD
jgi:hypothetical protein